MPSPRRRPLRIALLTYRGKPHCGGQGVYTRHLSRELVALGHQVTVISGPPYPVIDDGVELVELPSLDLYRDPDPFRIPKLSEFHDWVDVAEFAMMGTAAFPEPMTFGWRAWRHLRDRVADFDLVHDNQSLGYGLIRIQQLGLPVMATIHHPITKDLELELAANAGHPWRRFTLRRFYAFTRMQSKVAQRLPRIVTVSTSSKHDIATGHGVDPSRMHVVPVGVDHDRWRPQPDVAKVPGRVMTTASADVAMKGLVYLLEALAKVRTERDDAHLVVVGTPRGDSPATKTIERLGLRGAVEFVGGVSDDDIVRLYAEAEVAVVPSLYEGFSLPAIEAMACGVPVVGTTGGAIPEVVGTDNETALIVPPGDAGALAAKLLLALDDPDLRGRIGAAGRQRALDRYSWQAAAKGTEEHYVALLDEMRRR
ncbi:MAG: glycosyltransferase family 4 protein [Actinomycetota bacterium]